MAEAIVPPEAKAFQPEKFGDWTLRERRPGCWYLANAAGVEIEFDAGSDYAGIKNVCGFAIDPPVDAIARLLDLRSAFLANLPTLASKAHDGHETSLRSSLAREIEVLLGKWEDEELPAEAAENNWTLAEFLGDGLAKLPSSAFLVEAIEAVTNFEVRKTLAELRATVETLRQLPQIFNLEDAIGEIDQLAERFQ